MNTLLRPQLIVTVLLFAAFLAPQVSQAEKSSWRSKQPKLGPPPKLVLPAFERAKLDNGLTVLAARQPTLPLVAFQLVTRGGAALDPKDKHGLGQLVYGMLNEGAGDRDALAFSDAVADLGASFSAGCARDRGSVSIAGLARHKPALTALMADAVLRPQLALKDFKRLQARSIASLEAQLGSPRGLAFLRFPSLIYGADHPLGHPPSGTPESLRQTQLNAVKEHHKELLSPERSAFVAVGDITLKEAVQLAKTHFGAWKNSNKAPFEIPPVKASKRTHIVLLDKAGSPQTMAVLGRPLFGRGHPDEDPLTLANGAWGGSFASRLNMNLREEKGYTYGAGSHVSFRRGVGVFTAYAALQRKFTAAGLKEFFVEFKRLKKEPISPTEITRVKRGIIRGLPGDFEGIGSLASAASEIFAYDLPLDHLVQKAARLEAVPLKSIHKAAEDYFDSNVMKILLVGDTQSILSDLKAMNIGPIQLEKALHHR